MYIVQQIYSIYLIKQTITALNKHLCKYRKPIDEHNFFFKQSTKLCAMLRENCNFEHIKNSHIIFLSILFSPFLLFSFLANISFK